MKISTYRIRILNQFFQLLNREILLPDRGRTLSRFNQSPSNDYQFPIDTRETIVGGWSLWDNSKRRRRRSFPFLEPRSSEVTRRFDGKTRFGQQVGHLAGFHQGEEDLRDLNMGITRLAKAMWCRAWSCATGTP